ncbi:Transcriptional adapter 2-beta [Tyrophagus putrescentiae]|nr:Transcriptional adapter 2-beta [Tyrophagus putrescentiae]
MEDKLFELGSNGDPQKHFCTYCMNSINDVVFSCADCTDEIFLCMQCYVSGAEIGSHKKIHAVKMIDLGTFPVFGKRRKPKKPDRKSAASTSSDSHNKGRSHKCKDSSCRLYASGGEASDSEEDVRKKRQPVKRASFHYELDRGVLVKKFDADPSTSKKNRVWRALDELELLDAIQRYGYGNWKDIASTLSSGMPGITPEEVADHYAIHYILTDIGDYTWDWKTDCPRIMDIYAANEERKNTPKDPLSTFDDISQFELDALGFMPKRNDFEREFDNEAESLISNLTVNPGGRG